MYIITNGTFPSNSSMKRMKNFNETLDANSLRQTPEAQKEQNNVHTTTSNRNANKSAKY